MDELLQARSGNGANLQSIEGSDGLPTGTGGIEGAPQARAGAWGSLGSSSAFCTSCRKSKEVVGARQICQALSPVAFFRVAQIAIKKRTSLNDSSVDNV